MPNTGRIRYREVDQNPNSPTFGQERWGDYEVNATACPVPMRYFSVGLQADVVKNDCANGLYGSSVRYVLPQGSYTSSVSQEDADTQAQNFFNNNKQAYANQNGTCSNTPLRSVSITAIQRLNKAANITLVRTDTTDELRVTVVVGAQGDDGSGTGPTSLSATATATIPIGSSTKVLTVSFGGAVLSSVDDANITAVDPADYAY